MSSGILHTCGKDLADVSLVALKQVTCFPVGRVMSSLQGTPGEPLTFLTCSGAGQVRFNSCSSRCCLADSHSISVNGIHDPLSPRLCCFIPDLTRWFYFPNGQ